MNDILTILTNAKNSEHYNHDEFYNATQIIFNNKLNKLNFY